ncbi:alpha/beta hydrolase family protein [Hymenobacter rigui]|uniref:Alpha/beta hydrolase n=1 Tax=Hymenobacter rigui TaxID=334424 RepID=A0A3R9PDV0_9BACT|nr:alpha/beta fold hydrolase [Hymenobacter rigui]RSK50001.1 alpha/beta hydrolase [Hymenobacter rigui]
MPDFVGYCAAEVADPELGLTFPLAILYPTDEPGRLHPLGPYELEVALNAPVRVGRWPVVLISHGTGGSGLTHRNLAHYLARHGVVVALPEHPHNNRSDDTWAHTPQNLMARPRHLQLALDSILQNARLAPALKPDGAVLIGHSLGGYTVLAAAGGQPWSVSREPDTAPPRPILVPPADTRVKALVLLAPAVPWFGVAGALAQMRLPVLLLAGEQDEFIPPQHVETVLRGVPDAAQVTYRIVENAGHFSFLSPFPAARTSSAFLPSQDPPGFSRSRFHEELYPEILAFIRQTT